MAASSTFRTRYPLRAVVFVVGASLLALVDLVLMALFLMPLIPLIPIFVSVVIGHACLVSAAVSHAASLAHAEPVSTGRGETRAEAVRAPGVEARGAEA